MIPVILESPYASRLPAGSPWIKHATDRSENVRYGYACVKDCLMRGETAFAAHLVFPQCLDDENPIERALGFQAARPWYDHAKKCVLYVDRGLSQGMLVGRTIAEGLGLVVEQRRLGGKWVS